MAALNCEFLVGIVLFSMYLDRSLADLWHGQTEVVFKACLQKDLLVISIDHSA